MQSYFPDAQLPNLDNILFVNIYFITNCGNCRHKAVNNGDGLLSCKRSPCCQLNRFHKNGASSSAANHNNFLALVIATYNKRKSSPCLR